MSPERQVIILKRRLELSERNWIRAAKKALEGDLRELRNRVELYEAEPLELTLSESAE